MESYDPHTNKWSPVANMCKRRGGVGVGLSLSSFFHCFLALTSLGGGGERVPLRHRRPRRTCRLQSSAVEVQLHGKVYSHSNWKNAFNCKYEPWISSITVIVTIVSWCRYDPATDTWTMVANLSVGRDAIGDKQSLFVYLLMLMLMQFYSRRLCVG